jgi:hypothetical protein
MWADGPTRPPYHVIHFVSYFVISSLVTAKCDNEDDTIGQFVHLEVCLYCMHCDCVGEVAAIKLLHTSTMRLHAHVCTYIYIYIHEYNSNAILMSSPEMLLGTAKCMHFLLNITTLLARL